jgi:hypothetical protein
MRSQPGGGRRGVTPRSRRSRRLPQMLTNIAGSPTPRKLGGKTPLWARTARPAARTGIFVPETWRRSAWCWRPAARGCPIRWPWPRALRCCSSASRLPPRCTVGCPGSSQPRGRPRRPLSGRAMRWAGTRHHAPASPAQANPAAMALSAALHPVPASRASPGAWEPADQAAMDQESRDMSQQSQSPGNGRSVPIPPNGAATASSGHPRSGPTPSARSPADGPVPARADHGTACIAGHASPGPGSPRQAAPRPAAIRLASPGPAVGGAVRDSDSAGGPHGPGPATADGDPTTSDRGRGIGRAAPDAAVLGCHAVSRGDRPAARVRLTAGCDG